MGCQFSAIRRAPPSRQISPQYSRTTFASPPSPSHNRYEGLLMRRGAQKERSRRQANRIDVLQVPDDVLLEIFDFYVDNSLSYEDKTETESWQLLVHVCRRWRTLVLESPRRLNLRLVCTPETPARDTLDVWPALPLIVRGNMISSDMDNIITALGQSNRICQVSLWDLAGWQLEQVLAAMHVSFPELTDLYLSSKGQTVPVIPDSFLDGSPPRLRYLRLSGIPFLGLPKLLLSTTQLSSLLLENIPHSGYISPTAIVALISVLSNLRILILEFQSPRSRPGHGTRLLPPSKRSVIPLLRYFHFKGVIEYLEDLVTGIDTPRLERLDVTFFNQIDFDTPRLVQFINRTLKLENRDATVQFNDYSTRVELSLRTLEIAISCREPGWQLSSIEQVCGSLPALSTVEFLYIDHQYQHLVWRDDVIDNTLWLQLLRPFTAVTYLFLSKDFAPGIAAALQELVGERITEVLPSLQNIFVEGLDPSGPVQKDIGQFVAARQLPDHSITISDWNKDSNLTPK